LEGLGLEAVGVGMDQKAIAVDDDNCTNQPHIFAVGDCTNRKQLTPVAKAAGQAFADTIFGNQPHRVNYDLIPSAVMARPEAASVGMTEAEARAVHGDRVECYRTEFQPLLYSLSDRPGQGLFKLVVQRENDRVLGVHAVGDHVAEIIQMLTLALQKGVTKQELDRTIGIHPTSGEEIFTLD
jgi:glutathione reductase (NADPH)